MNRQKNSQPSGVPEAGFLRLPAVLAAIPVSRSTWWAGIREGRYPPPVKLSPRVTAWRVADIRALIEELGTARGPER
jgi:predicted DNA-binding transcriptional regulator AlpA